MYGYNNACVDHRTIKNMEQRGASQNQIDWAKKTQYSTDARDVARHRELINKYNPGDPWREPNNFILHPDSYRFGSGNRSPEFIGGMFGTLQHL